MSVENSINEFEIKKKRPKNEASPGANAIQGRRDVIRVILVFILSTLISIVWIYEISSARSDYTNSPKQSENVLEKQRRRKAWATWFDDLIQGTIIAVIVSIISLLAAKLLHEKPSILNHSIIIGLEVTIVLALRTFHESSNFFHIFLCILILFFSSVVDGHTKTDKLKSLPFCFYYLTVFGAFTFTTTQVIMGLTLAVRILTSPLQFFLIFSCSCYLISFLSSYAFLLLEQAKMIRNDEINEKIFISRIFYPFCIIARYRFSHILMCLCSYMVLFSTRIMLAYAAKTEESLEETFTFDIIYSTINVLIALCYPVCTWPESLKFLHVTREYYSPTNSKSKIPVHYRELLGTSLLTSLLTSVNTLIVWGVYGYGPDDNPYVPVYIFILLYYSFLKDTFNATLTDESQYHPTLVSESAQ